MADSGKPGKSKKNKKNKNKEQKNGEQAQAQQTQNSDAGAAPETSSELAAISQLALNGQAGNMDLVKLKKALAEMQASKDVRDSRVDKKSFEFWSTQPVPKIDEVITTNEPIEEDVPVENLRKDPYTLPSGYQWDTLNLDDPIVLKELYVLLNENYVEDDDNMFRFDYSPEFLRWALMPPGYLKEWHAGVRVAKTSKLVGFISAVPAKIRIMELERKMVEINFLCVHKKLRAKRLAPVLIREITRRVNRQGTFQAVYTAGVVLPKPVATCRYWHRSLNVKKLVECKFSHLNRHITMQRQIKILKLPDEVKTEGLRPLALADVEQASQLLNEYLVKYKLVPQMDAAEFAHWFLPRDNIINSYVVEKEGKITDLISFYTLPSTVMCNPNYDCIKAAYSFYNVAKTVSWADLMCDALVLATKLDFDVFNALDLMDNVEFLDKLRFGIGDGNLQYYIYNWRCPQMQPNEVGLVLQ